MLIAMREKRQGIQDSPRIDGADNLMFLNVDKFIFKNKTVFLSAPYNL